LQYRMTAHVFFDTCEEWGPRGLRPSGLEDGNQEEILKGDGPKKVLYASYNQALYTLYFDTSR